MYFDTHVHVDGIPDAEGAAGALARAEAAGVGRLLAVGGDAERNAFAVACAVRHPGRIRAAVGYDRDSAGQVCPLDALEAWLRTSESVAAVGEVGLDYHYHPDTRARQRELLARMLDLAGRHQRPAIVHSREAEEDTIELLRAHRQSLAMGRAIGVLHCFTGDVRFAERLLELDLYISFSGIVTFRNADSIRQAARIVPDDRLLIETDSPYLAPVPYRGRPNEPALIGEVARTVAEVRGVPVARIAELTLRNANRLFNWPAADPSA